MSELPFLFNFLAVPFIVGQLINNAKINGGNRQRGLIYAAVFLVLSALTLTIIDVRDDRPSFYSVLNIPADATPSDVKRAYKAAAVKLHPDKNPSPSAQSDFTELQRINEILENPALRRIYDRFGPDAAISAMNSPLQSQSILGRDNGFLSGQSLIYYGIWFVLTYLLCLSRDSRQGRTIGWLSLATTGMLEMAMINGLYNPLSSLFPMTPVYVKIRFLHSFYPSLMHAARLFSQVIWVDFESMQHQLMIEILKSNAMILNTVMQIQASVDARAGVSAEGEVVDDGAGIAALPLAARMRNQQSKVTALQQQMAETKAGGRFGIPSWLVPIGLMILMNYLGRGETQSRQYSH